MKTFDVIIVGGGLAGLSTAAHMIEKNKDLRILVYDATKIGDSASGVPGGMVNPIMGQNNALIWGAKSCLQMFEQRLLKLSEYSDTQLNIDNGVLRPAIDDNMRNHFRSSSKGPRWAREWAEWISSDSLEKKIPWLKGTSGGLFIKKGRVIRTAEYLEAYTKYLKEKGVTFRFGGPYQLNNQSGWLLDNDKKKYTTGTLIIASGYKSRENKYWGELPLQSVKGQLAIYECDEQVNSYPAVSSYGYITPIDTHQLVVGSTYEHHFFDEGPDAEGAGLLDQKLKELLPDLYPKCTHTGQWSGIRATTPDHLPVIGKHPLEENMYVYTGLGSRGLLYSEYMASLLADHVVTGKDLPEKISLYRFSRFRRMLKLKTV